MKPTYIAYVLDRNSQVTYYACAMYIDRSEFNRSPKPTAAPIFRSHRIRENCFPFHEMPQKCTFMGWGHFREMFIFTDRSCETSFERNHSAGWFSSPCTFVLTFKSSKNSFAFKHTLPTNHLIPFVLQSYSQFRIRGCQPIAQSSNQMF